MNNIYSIGLLGLLDATITWNNSPIKALVVDSTYSFDMTDEFVSDVSGSEVTNSVGTGYERKTLLNNLVDLTSNVVALRSDDLVFSSVQTAEVWDALVIFQQGTLDTDSRLIAYLPIDAVVTNGTSVTVAFTDLIRFPNS